MANTKRTGNTKGLVSDAYKNEKLRVFREWSKWEKSGRGRPTTAKQWEAQEKGQADLRKKVTGSKRKK